MKRDSNEINSTDIAKGFPPTLPEGIEETDLKGFSHSETLLVEKQTLIAAMLELERQEEIQTCLALAHIHHIEASLQRLKETLQGERSLCAKHKLHQLFLPQSDWIKLFTDAPYRRLANGSEKGLQ